MVAQESDPVVDYKTLTVPVKSAVDKFDLLPAFLKVRGLVKEHIDSFNYFIDHGIHKIVEANKRLVCVHDPTLFLEYKRIYVGNPTVHVDLVEQKITPQMCRLSDRTYAAPIFVDVEFTKGNQPNKQIEQRQRMQIGQMPIMLRSSHCVLRGKDEAELAKLGECPLDPGGYFIAKGNEKVILIQEQLSKNRIIIDRDSKGRVSASVTSSTHETKSKTVFFMEKDKIYLQLNQFSKPVPIMIILKAMGIESDQEIVQMLGRDPRYGSLLLPSIQECYSEKIYTQKQALDYLDEKAGSTGAARARIRKEGEARKIIRDIFLANVPVSHGNFRPKCIYAAVMLRRMMDAILNSDTMDDKDYVGNKRLELSGQLMSLLFEDLFKTMNTHALEHVNSAYSKSNSAMLDFTSVLQRFSPITQGLERAISTGNWDLKRFKMHRKGVSQGLCRLSFIAALGHMTRISPQFEKTRKVSGPRALQPSQWGMLCPCDTPEGEACGLTKNLALMTHVTTDEEEGPIISVCQSLGVQDLASLSGEEIHSPTSFLVIFNGLILGKHKDPKRFANAMRKLRRKGKLGEFVSIFVNDQQRCVYVASDGGRVCRPLVIADEGVSRIKEHHMKELRDGVRCFNDFLRDGLIEYLDVNEENNAVISLYEHQDKDLNGEKNEVDRKSITHVEIEPFTILGVCAGLIPYPHHNQSPRNTYQCAMGKQAMGNIAYNQLFRADSLIYLLVYPQRPLLTTKSIELVGYDKLGAGQNATVAVMSYSGYDIEDAIVMNKSSLDRGFGRCITMKKYSVLKEKTDRIIRPQNEQNKQILDADGIAAPGEIIRNHDIYVNKQSPKNPRDSSALKDQVYVDSNAKYKGVEGETTVVDRVLLCSDTDDKLSIKCIIRHTRRPELSRINSREERKRSGMEKGGVGGMEEGGAKEQKGMEEE
ncbi:uncharacterized protein A4U43_C01F29520 [Asparagus officinalis]|uniref:DNA-directed RNA polymerase n=1 Tax=Asparagus officinalis TaxID=4686 RepID=A0A5P1FT39_ASPOF|nr:uncharacterized protein A4U43_C01F29520 [Asparagus officinalis]